MAHEIDLGGVDGSFLLDLVDDLSDVIGVIGVGVEVIATGFRCAPESFVVLIDGAIGVDINNSAFARFVGEAHVIFLVHAAGGVAMEHDQ